MDEGREPKAGTEKPGAPDRGPNTDPRFPYAEERPFWVGVAVVLSLAVAGLVLVFFAVRVGLPRLLGG